MHSFSGGAAAVLRLSVCISNSHLKPLSSVMQTSVHVHHRSKYVDYILTHTHTHTLRQPDAYASLSSYIYTHTQTHRVSAWLSSILRLRRDGGDAAFRYVGDAMRFERAPWWRSQRRQRRASATMACVRGCGLGSAMVVVAVGMETRASICASTLAKIVRVI